jgi:hypothetical protein
MPKAKPHLDQLGFNFTEPKPARGAGALAGFEREVCNLVGTILASDPRSRYEIAAAMSEVLGEDITKTMLDAWASGAREDHRVAFTRLCALVLVTDRQDLLRPVMAKLGVSLLIGAEVENARIGHLDLIIERAQREKREIKSRAQPIHTHRKED